MKTVTHKDAENILASLIGQYTPQNPMMDPRLHIASQGIPKGQSPDFYLGMITFITYQLNLEQERKDEHRMSELSVMMFAAAFVYMATVKEGEN